MAKATKQMLRMLTAGHKCEELSGLFGESLISHHEARQEMNQACTGIAPVKSCRKAYDRWEAKQELEDTLWWRRHTAR